jgi:uncharacterized protein YbjT (DUF2867 family)
VTASTTIDERRALLAGATGLVGRALLALLLDSPRYRRVQVLLRREAPELAAHRKLTVAVVDFAALPSVPPADDVFIALGTTIKAAGSQQAFRRVDFDAVVGTARAGRAAGAKRLLVVSALGADAASSVFYNRVKGEMEQAVGALGYDSVVIARPSLLLGDRASVGAAAAAAGARLGAGARAAHPRAGRCQLDAARGARDPAWRADPRFKPDAAWLGTSRCLRSNPCRQEESRSSSKERDPSRSSSSTAGPTPIACGTGRWRR